MPALLSRTLGVICPSCDFLNVVGAARCMACGTATDAAPEVDRHQARTVHLVIDPTAQDTAPGVPALQVEATPPGLRRASSPSPAPGLAAAPPGPSGARGQPARPTFSSSTANPVVAPPPGPRFGLTVMAGPSRGQRFKLSTTGAQIGRSRGAILFPDDPFVSPLHATLAVREGKLFVHDEHSTSGVFVSIGGTEAVTPGTSFCAGLRLFRYVGKIEPNPPWNRRDVIVYGAPLPNNQAHHSVEEILLGDRPGRCVITSGPVLTIGQGRCDFSYPNDEGLAPRHCELAPLPNGVVIRDLSGGLGTFVRITDERPLKPGDRIRIGQQTLQVEALG